MPLRLAKAMMHCSNTIRSVQPDDKKKKPTMANIPATAITWTCRYKITSPSGFSNMPSNRDAVAFSDDSSVLSIAYGNFVTFWDNQETRLLTTARHLDGDGASGNPIESLTFVKSSRCEDMLLTQSKGGVTLQSPFGAASARSLPHWNWGVPQYKRNRLVVTSACLLETHDCIAVSIYHKSRDESEIVFIDMDSGEVGLRDDSDDGDPLATFVGGICGRIVSLRSVGKRLTVSRWENAEKKNLRSRNLVRLYALTHRGELLSIVEHGRGGEDTTKSTELNNQGQLLPDRGGPRLNIISQQRPPSSSDDQGTNKRRRLGGYQDPLVEQGNHSMPATPRLAIDNFGMDVVGNDTTRAASSTGDLPALNGSFVRAFVGRGLSRHGK